MAKIQIKLKDPSTKISYSRPQLDIDYYPVFLSPTEANDIYEQLRTQLGLANVSHSKRTTYIYGQAGLTYQIDFKGFTSKRSAIDWHKLPVLTLLKERITQLTGQCANFCVIQYYPNGQIIIPPHRDKEVTPGTSICGLSLGSLRTMHLDPPKWWSSNSKSTKSSNLDINRLSLNLSSGSLYILNPPTNDCWAHSISKSNLETPRLSLTFRLIT